MRLNRRGMTGIVDAMFFIMLVGIAVAMMGTVATDTYDPRENVEDPSDVCDALFQSYMPASDLGIDGDDGRAHTLPMLAAVSMKKGDGCVAGYIRGILDSTYPWNGAYCMVLECDGQEETIGDRSELHSKSFEKEYYAGYGKYIRVSLFVYG